MGYNVDIISIDDTHMYLNKMPHFTWERKANIFGICVKIITNSMRIKDAWEDNFYFMSENVKSHGRIYAFYDEDEESYVKYEPYTNTAVLKNITYYGYVKSIALALAGDILEDSHSIYSIHGAALDIDGKGVSIIAPSGTGKTTHSFGLLQMKDARLVSDDWYYVYIQNDDAIAYSSEKNCYIRDDITKIWPEYEDLLNKIRLDREKRGIADPRWIVGKGHVRNYTTMSKIIFLKRDYSSEDIVVELDKNESVDYMIKNNYCNPHLLVRDERKEKLRQDFLKKYFSITENYLVNTILEPTETQKRIREIAIKR